MKRPPLDGGQCWDPWWPLPYVFYLVLRAPSRTRAPPRKVPTGALASVLAWAGGFPAPRDLEGQRSTRQARGFRSGAASPSSPPLRPRPPWTAQPRRAQPPAPGPEPGPGGESSEDLTHALRTRVLPGPVLAL
ncbi:unnamed protein product [Rangifer tarandus platyrhynchus]|uniref:Uncharacterized protein n=1 Tax=Rangifer tarandus platyrhynchus TaxID=3082113 RepID=A0ABN9A413_RANTA|nr:unnamed protein product [Rangifer tarandus platyrhynchus]